MHSAECGVRTAIHRSRPLGWNDAILLGLFFATRRVTAVVLKDLTDVKGLDGPTNISPRTVSIDVKSPSFKQTVPAHALMVLRDPL